jgi:hypothetical protein
VKMRSKNDEFWGASRDWLLWAEIWPFCGDRGCTSGPDGAHWPGWATNAKTRKTKECCLCCIPGWAPAGRDLVVCRGPGAFYFCRVGPPARTRKTPAAHAGLAEKVKETNTGGLARHVDVESAVTRIVLAMLYVMVRVRIEARAPQQTIAEGRGAPPTPFLLAGLPAWRPAGQQHQSAGRYRGRAGRTTARTQASRTHSGVRVSTHRACGTGFDVHNQTLVTRGKLGGCGPRISACLSSSLSPPRPS